MFDKYKLNLKTIEHKIRYTMSEQDNIYKCIDES